MKGQLADKGKLILQETRSFDALNGNTFSMRSKEEANDYRYFPDPDLPPFDVPAEELKRIAESIPALPEELIARYTGTYNLSRYDAEVITDDKATADYFEALIQIKPSYKAAANWLLGPVKSHLNESGIAITDFVLSPAAMASLIGLVEEGGLNFSSASSGLFSELLKSPASDPRELATKLNLIQTGDEDKILEWVKEAMEKMPEKVIEYRKGKKGLLGLFVGEVKKLSKGKAWTHF